MKVLYIWLFKESGGALNGFVQCPCIITRYNYGHFSDGQPVATINKRKQPTKQTVPISYYQEVREVLSLRYTILIYVICRNDSKESK